MKKSILFGGFILIISIFLSGCSEQPTETKNPDLLNVYTTVYPLEYFTERIGGTYVEVESIYPPGADEHTFEPSQKDMIKLAESDLFIFIGLGLEGFVEKAKGTLKTEDVTMLAAGERIHFEDSIDHEDENHGESSHGDENHEADAHDDGSHEEAGHEDQNHGADAHGDGSHEEAGHEDENHEADAHGDGSHEEAGHEDENHEADAHGDGSHEEAGHEDENHEADAHGDGSHEEAGHEGENHEADAHGETEHEGEHNHNHGDIDPHVWIDPVYAKDLAAAIKDQLILELPSHEETFNENYQALIKDLDKLNSQFNEMVTSAKHHEIIVSHSAFGYWEERYGIEQISISGMSTTSEPSQKELQNLIDHGKKAELKYVLFEQNFQSRLGEAVQKELGAKSLTLHNLSVLTEEDLNNGETYFSLMEKNLETLKKALND
ncbi:zinc transport system substrate-binding protein [Mesobacillus persicus]|uniref:Zinc transport system substrate-binding protein n=1 Tax=Mesobacillus persicus TaxID=930146 RepID=A0A1H7Y6A0_9BACI|nr:zinc ABC transporter substrate-binding protein [Mesobacillus persicus]SEM40848.1 zinc transport system substrate-binding protein [Mesobacillus persicus]